MSTALAFSAYGDPDVLGLVDVPQPHAGPGEIRVRVRAAGVQPFDCAFRRGDLQGIMATRFPQVAADQVAARPPALPCHVAGGLSASGQTAYNALRDLDVGG